MIVSSTNSRQSGDKRNFRHSRGLSPGVTRGSGDEGTFI